MSHVNGRRSGGGSRALSKGPHHVIIARGDKIRSFAVRPLSIIAGALVAIVVVSGALATVAINLFKEDSSIGAIAEQNRIRQQYELQIADLHRQMDALVSRQLVEREVLNNQVAELLDRQDDLVERQELLTGLATDALAAGIDVLPMLAPVPTTNPLRGAAITPAGAPTTAAGIGGPIDPMTTGTTPEPTPDRQAAIPHSEALATVEATADWVAETQLDALALLAGAITERSGLLASKLEALGYAPESGGGVGGPFEPAFGPEDLGQVTAELDALEDLQAFARSLPLAWPLAELDVTSPFGRRSDPFLGEAAMHTGVDLRAAAGTTVKATGPGTVVSADYSGGYGNMVEIHHGNGISTRYGHLSSILVEVGDVVTTGTIIGRAGSTGRITGPHLHYEILRNGVAFDPMAHLRTGRDIAALL
jgi:hypothetical protein